MIRGEPSGFSAFFCAKRARHCRPSIAARADADAVYVAAQHGIRPNGYVFGKRYFADDDGGLVDEAGFVDLGVWSKGRIGFMLFSFF